MNFGKRNNFKVTFTSGEIEPHEVVLDDLTTKKSSEIGITERKIEVPLLRAIIYRFFIFTAIIFVLLTARVFQLQIVKADEFLTKANENTYILSKIQAERGVIYDKNMKQLVFNVPRFDLICNKEDLPKSTENKEQIIKNMSKILDMDYEELSQKIESAESQVLISENLDHETLIVLESRIEEFKGFKIEQISTRNYVQGEDFSHLIGYVGKISSEEWKTEPECYSFSDCVGRSGIEDYYEDYLRKDPGQVKIERDALGNLISQEIIELPSSGQSLVLWLDSELQSKIKQELEKVLSSTGSTKAAAVALDPNTGGVLSMVSLPSFDNNAFSTGNKEILDQILNDEKKPLFNRTMSGIGYVTGSTIKPLVATAALEEGIISPLKSINCIGLLEVEHEYDPSIVYQYHDWSIHGITDMRKALAESCNVYFYSLGGGNKNFNIKGLGPETIKEYLALFGWGKQTGIDLLNEGSGFLPKINKDWRLGNTYHFSIGQGAFGVTPLQVANAFSVIANGGRLIEPRVVQKIVTKEQGKIEVVKEIGIKVIAEGFVDLKNIQIVREGMRQAVTAKNSPQASSKILNALPVAVAAKTGTAETSVEGVYHNWVTVFAPYENPEIVLTIMIEDVKGVQAAVLPVAFEVLNWYFTK